MNVFEGVDDGTVVSSKDAVDAKKKNFPRTGKSNAALRKRPRVETSQFWRGRCYGVCVANNGCPQLGVAYVSTMEHEYMNSNKLSICANCLALGFDKPLKRCAGCGMVDYCGKEYVLGLSSASPTSETF